MRKTGLAILWWMGGCSPEPCPSGSVRLDDGLCHLVDDESKPARAGSDDTDTAHGGGGDSGPPDSADPGTDPPCGAPPDSWSLGDPIQALGASETDEFMEHLDVALLGDGRALVGANNGWSVLDVDSGSFTHVAWAGARSVFRLAADPEAGLAWGGTQSRGLYRFDITVDPPVVVGEHRPWAGWHGDVAASEAHALVAALEDGAWLLDATGAPLGQLAGTVTAVALDGTIGWVAGHSTVRRVDWSDPSEPVVTATVAIPAPATDAAGSADRVVLALGGGGVLVVDHVDDALVLHPTLPTHGAAYGVALDGDSFWAATWFSVSVGGMAGGVPTWWGDEPAARYALGVDASGGRAVAADWTRVSRFAYSEGLGGPELRVPSRVDVAAGDPAAVTVENGGAGLLSVSFAGEGMTVEPSELALCPGEWDRVVVTASAGWAEASALEVHSDDPDEATVSVDIIAAAAGIGQPHEPFTLQAITPPAAGTTPWSLAEHAGELVYIAWFAPT